MEGKPLLDEAKENESENTPFDSYNKYVLIPFRDFDSYKSMKAGEIPNQYEKKIKQLTDEAGKTSLPVRTRIQILDHVAALKEQLKNKEYISSFSIK